MKFNEILLEFEAGKSIRRKSWPLNKHYNKNDNFELSVADIIADADDWEIWEESPYDELLEEMKQLGELDTPEVDPWSTAEAGNSS